MVLSQLQEVASRLKSIICENVCSCRVDALALSGGLDSSILASCLPSNSVHAYTVAAKDFLSSDLVNAQLVAKLYGIDQTVISAGMDDLLQAIDHTIKILKVFNPIEIRNNVVVYLVMKRAKDDGYRSIMTGDGADELFGGYNFFQKLSLDELQKDLERIWKVMHFPSKSLSEAIGIDLRSPFLSEEVTTFAKSIGAELKVRDENGKKYGKWILRKAFEKKLPSVIAWREKVAMQDGSGTSGLTNFFDGLVPDHAFSEKSEKYKVHEHVKFASKETLYYYEIYRKHYDYPTKLGKSKNGCPQCGFDVEKGSRFCRMCGSFPI